MKPNEDKSKKQARSGFFISKQTFDAILRQKSRRVSDMIALLGFYHYTGLWQDTNQPRASLKYVAKGLHWGRDKVRATRSLLLKLRLIEDVRAVDPVTAKVTGWFVRLLYFHPTDLPESGFYQRVDSKATNALRDNKTNALRSDRGAPTRTREAAAAGNSKISSSDLSLEEAEKHPLWKEFEAYCKSKNGSPNLKGFNTWLKSQSSRNGAPKPIPIAKRNKIINELNRQKQMVLRTFPDGEFAPWATEKLAAIDRQLQKL
jgi:hypothetical protein